MITIVQKGDPVLRKVAREVPLKDITSPEIKEILERMKRALYKEEDGVAIAAPQIGESLRIFVVSGKIFSSNYPDIKETEILSPDLVFINPKIDKFSKRKKKVPEGCLSVRWLYGNVNRSTQVTLTAYDEDGKKFTRGASGLLAQVFQHEVDHLNGILFVDTAEDIENVPPQEQKTNE